MRFQVFAASHWIWENKTTSDFLTNVGYYKENSILWNLVRNTDSTYPVSDTSSRLMALDGYYVSDNYTKNTI